MKIVVCDDNPQFLQFFHKQILSLATPDDIVTAYTGGMQVLDEIIKFSSPVDLLFLDIEMPGLSGLESANEITKASPDTTIVLVTNYSQYALEAFQAGVSNYLLKPINQAVLSKIIDKYRHQKFNQSKIISVKSQGEINLIRQNDILYIKRQDRKIYLHLLGDVIIWPGQTLADLECKLRADGFFRIHQSYIVNLRHVRRYKKLQALMTNGETIPVGDRNVKDFQTALLIYRR